MGFEPTISAGKRPQTYALNRSATGTGTSTIVSLLSYKLRVLYAAKKHARNENSVHGFCQNTWRSQIAWRPKHKKEDALKEKDALIS
jgi:hypothetical protein